MERRSTQSLSSSVRKSRASVKWVRRWRQVARARALVMPVPPVASLPTESFEQPLDMRIDVLKGIGLLMIWRSRKFDGNVRIFA